MMNRQTKRAILSAVVVAGLITPAQSKTALFIPKAPAIIKPAEFWKPHEGKLLKAMPMTMGLMIPSSAAPPTHEFAGYTVNTSNTSTYTYTTHAIGTAADDRLVVIAVMRLRASGTVNISSVICGGNAMTAVPGAATTMGSVTCGITFYQLVVVAGTTATIVVTTSASANNCAIAVWALYGLLSTTCESSDVANGTPWGLDFTNSADAIVLSAGMANAVTSATWAGATEQFDGTSEGAMTHSGASIEGASANLTVTPTFADTTGLVTAGAAWR